MEWVRRLFRTQGPLPPGPRDGDIIYPLHFLDNDPVVQASVMTYIIRFNDVLDHDMIHTALVKVLETGDWRKLGGRLAKKGSMLYIYSPASYTPERPALTFTHEKFDIGIDEHPAGKLLPRKASGQPSISINARELFEPLAFGPGTPLVTKDYLSRDVPILSVHTVIFEDSTLVSICWPHAVMDALGLQGLLAAWTAALSGKDSDIPAVLGARNDILDDFSEKIYGRKELMIQSLRLTGLKFWLFIMHIFYEILFGPALGTFLVALPKDAVNRLRKEVEADLGSLEVKCDHMDDGSRGEVQEKISRGDIVYSWFIHHVALAVPKPRPIICCAMVNVRKRLPGHFDKAFPSVYIQNMMLSVCTSLSAMETAKASIGQIARRLRRSLIAQGPADQLVAQLQAKQREKKETGRYTIFMIGETNSSYIHSTNWSIADMLRVVDFSPAVLRTGDGPSTRTNPLGTGIYHFVDFTKRPPLVRTGLSILGTDHEGTTWLMGWANARTMSKMEESIRKMSS